MEFKVHLLTKAIILNFIFIAHLHANEILVQHKDHPLNTNYQRMKLLGAVKIIPSNKEGMMNRELSGLAYDNDNDVLYALSDDGYISHFSLSFENNILTNVALKGSYRLKDSAGNTLPESNADAEGLAINFGNNKLRDDAQLIISLNDPTRIEYYTPRGAYIRTLVMSNKAKEFIKNNEVNSLAGSLEKGIYMFGLDSYKESHLVYFSGTDEVIKLNLDDYKNIQILGADKSNDGSVVFVDRKYSSMFKPIIYCIRELVNNKTIKDIACMNHKEGWLIDNYEGLTHIENNRYLLVSDDNESMMQSTILLHFGIIK